MNIPYETLLDAAARHFEAVARSANYTRAARNEASELARSVREELHKRNDTESVVLAEGLAA